MLCCCINSPIKPCKTLYPEEACSLVGGVGLREMISGAIVYELALLSFVQTESYLAEVASCLFLQHALHVQVDCPIADGRRAQILAQVTVSFERLNDLHLCIPYQLPSPHEHAAALWHLAP